MMAEPADLIHFLIDMGKQPGVLWQRSGSSKIFNIGLGAFIRKIGSLVIRVAEIPQPKVGRIRFTASRRMENVWVLEIPPGIYSISEEVVREDERVLVRRKIALPYMYLFVSSRLDATIYIFCRPGPVESMDDYLCTNPLPNSAEGQLCIGTNRFINRGDQNESVVDWAVRMLFDAPFNTEQTADADECRKADFSIPQNLTEWETRTVRNPTFVNDLRWPPANIRVREAMIRCLARSKPTEELITALLEEE